jgi:transmembrane sensor
MTESGEPFVVLEPKGRRSQSLEFGDGSTITAEAGTRVVPLAASERDVVLELSRGTAHFSIKPNGPVRWIIETGNASVEVVGTVFSLVRSPDRVDVRVSRGAVLVRSEGLETRVRRLEAGGTLSLRVPGRNAASVALPEPAAKKMASMSEPSISEPIGRSATASGGSGGTPPKPEGRLSADALLVRADEARLANDTERARHWLGLFLERFPRDARAGVSAFTLAGLEARAGASPRHQVAAFRRALELSTSAMLREDCYLRLIEAEVLTLDRKSARKTLAEYRREFPQGRHLANCERLVKGEEPSRVAPAAP